MHILKKHNLEDIIKNDYTLKFSNVESLGVNYMEKLLILSVYPLHLSLKFIINTWSKLHWESTFPCNH